MIEYHEMASVASSALPARSATRSVAGGPARRRLIRDAQSTTPLAIVITKQDSSAFVEMLTVEHTFLLERPGVHMLVLSPNFSVPAGWSERGWSERSLSVQVRRPDDTTIDGHAQINMTHLNIRGCSDIDRRWRLTIWLTDKTEAEVPVGSTILVSPDVRAAILPSDA